MLLVFAADYVRCHSLPSDFFGRYSTLLVLLGPAAGWCGMTLTYNALPVEHVPLPGNWQDLLAGCPSNAPVV